MLVTQSIIEAPVMFAFIISLIIRYNITQTIDLAVGLKFLAIGLAMGLTCIGPSIGQSMLASSSCFSLGHFKHSYSRIFPFTLLGQAIIETPIAFSLLFSFLLIYTPLPAVPEGTSVIAVVVHVVVAALLVSIASVGPGIGMGLITSKSVRQVAQNPSLYQTLVKSMLVTCAFLEASLIYALIIGLLMITGAS
jgi:F-type H+-transporting ATPase subunit c